MADELAALEAAYLASDDPRGGSGFRGDEARWERLRRPIVAAIDRDGTFLDVGCANGHLLDCVVDWAFAAGHRIEPYGLDVSAALVARATDRLPPRWSALLFVGDVRTWTPPRRFDFVRTELSYALEADQPALLERLLREVVAPGGRLIACSYGSRTRPEREPLVDVAALLADWGHPIAGSAVGRDPDGLVLTNVAWIDASHCVPRPHRMPPAQ
jgi:trans-aconitate methyltransferase